MQKKHILIPLDNSEKTFESINLVKSLFNSENVTVTLLNVMDTYDLSIAEFGSPIVAKDASEEILTKAEDLIKEFKVNRLSIPGSNTSVVNDILDVAEKEDSDIIIMTKTGRGFYDKYIIGSTTSHVLKRSSIPVLIVP